MGELSQSSAELLRINQVWSKSPFASCLGHSTTSLSLQAGCKRSWRGGDHVSLTHLSSQEGHLLLSSITPRLPTGLRSAVQQSSGGAEPQRTTSPRVLLGDRAQGVTCTCCQQISFLADRYCSCVHLGAGGHALPLSSFHFDVKSVCLSGFEAMKYPSSDVTY